jgi:hypothetical protein
MKKGKKNEGLGCILLTKTLKGCMPIATAEIKPGIEDYSSKCSVRYLTND